MNIFEHLKSIRPNNVYFVSPRNRDQVIRALRIKNIKVGRHEVEIIRRFDGQQYDDFLVFCDREITAKKLGTVRVVFTSVREMFDVDFKKISVGDLDIRNGVLNFGYILDRIRGAADPRSSAAVTVYVPDASKLLTDDLLFNPKSGVNYPRNPGEYRALMARLVDKDGRFPEDADPLTQRGNFSPEAKGVKHLKLKRKERAFQVEILSPHLHAQGVGNRLIFDADLISQGASFDAYGTPGVSYDRESYYVRRLFNAERVPFVRIDGWPVSFAAMQGYQTVFGEKELYYAFIHFVMTRGLFQGCGLTSYSVREGMSSLFYSDVWHNKPNLMFDAKGNLRDYRFRMWAAAHSGRFTPFYAFVKGFGGVDPAWDPVAQAIFQDVHRRITPASELERRGVPISAGVVRANGGQFPIAVDREVYPPHTRYPTRNGKIDFPQSEVDLPSSIRDVWLDTIGREKGVAAGNALYFGGMVTLGKIQQAKKKERIKEGGGVERAGDSLRSFLVRHSGK